MAKDNNQEKKKTNKRQRKQRSVRRMRRPDHNDIGLIGDGYSHFRPLII